MSQAASKKKIFDNRYEILSIVGRGAASVVYHARHLSGSLGDVALKVLLSPKGDRTNAELLRKEALAMVSARHKYVIRLDDFHTLGDLAYLSMEYAPLFDLRKYAAQIGGKLGPVQGQLFLIQSAEALNFTHQAGIIHRDLKPDNLLVISDKEVRLGDFGVAVLPGEKSSIEDLQRGVGTMSYMAPEVLAGKGYDQKSDIYALAVCFYELLSGVHPFDKAPLAEQLKVREDGAFPSLEVLCPDLPKPLTSAIMKAMRANPDQRFKTAREMVQAIILPAHEVAEQSQLAAEEPAGSEIVHQASTTTEQIPIDAKAKETKAPDPHATANVIKGLHQVANKDPEESARKATVMIPKEKVQEIVKATEEPTPKAKSTLKPPRRNTEPPPPPATPFKNGLIAKVAMAAIVAAVVFWLGPVLKNLGLSIFAPAANVAENSQTFESPLPAYQGDALSFPNLPHGMFTGSISNVLPGVESPLTMIAYPDSSQVVVLLGIEGWKPSFADIPEADGSEEATPLRVKSSGFILDFTGQNVDGELMGYFRNVVSGEQGQWILRPVTIKN